MTHVILSPTVFPISGAMFTGNTPKKKLVKGHGGLLKEIAAEHGVAETKRFLLAPDPRFAAALFVWLPLAFGAALPLATAAGIGMVRKGDRAGMFLTGWLILLPFSHVFQLSFRYYHFLRWDDVPNERGSRIEKEVKASLERPVSWSASRRCWSESQPGETTSARVGLNVRR